MIKESKGIQDTPPALEALKTQINTFYRYSQVQKLNDLKQETSRLKKLKKVRINVWENEDSLMSLKKKAKFVSNYQNKKKFKLYKPHSSYKSTLRKLPISTDSQIESFLRKNFVSSNVIESVLEKLNSEQNPRFNHCLEALLEKHKDVVEDKATKVINKDKKLFKGTFKEKYSGFKKENGIPDESKVFALDKSLFEPLYYYLISKNWCHINIDLLEAYKAPYFDLYYGPAAKLGEFGIKKFGPRHILNFVEGTHSMGKKRGLASFMKSSIYLNDEMANQKKASGKVKPRFGRKKVCTKGLPEGSQLSRGIYQFDEHDGEQK